MRVSGENKPASSQDFGRQSRAALRIAGRKTGENRWARAFYRGGSAFLGSVRHVLGALWLEVTGFLFLVLAVIGGGAAVREYRRYVAGTTPLGKVVTGAMFTLLFLYFGVNSFWRARLKSKRG
jgi:hypothetical protein